MALPHAGIDCALFVKEDGETALAFLEALDADPKAIRIDLLLLDVHLPKLDGEGVLKRLRSMEHCAQTPVIVMTASDAAEDHDMAEKHAAIHYFRKPDNLDQFMQLGVIVRDILSRRKPVNNESQGLPQRAEGA